MGRKIIIDENSRCGKPGCHEIAVNENEIEELPAMIKEIKTTRNEVASIISEVSRPSVSDETLFILTDEIISKVSPHANHVTAECKILGECKESEPQPECSHNDIVILSGEISICYDCVTYDDTYSYYIAYKESEPQPLTEFEVVICKTHNELKDKCLFDIGCKFITTQGRFYA